MESTVNADTPPYAEAIRLIQRIATGPDSGLIHSDTPDPATNAFLNRNALMFHLLHQGAISKSTQWDADTSDITRLQVQILSVSDLCRLSVLRARTSLELGEPIRSRDDLLNAMALVRNVTNGLPFRIVKFIELSDEVMLLRSMAEVLPSLPLDEVRQMTTRLGQLPVAVSPGAAICTDPRFYAIQFARFPTPPPGLQQGLDAFSLFCEASAKAIDREPPLSSADLERLLVDLASSIGPDVPRVGHTLAEQSVRAFTSFHSSVCFHHEETAMFQYGLAIVRDGPNAVQASVDSKSNGSFSYIPVDQGFVIRKTSLSPCTGKPITLRFGRTKREQT
jgi:hypothetical protein